MVGEQALRYQVRRVDANAPSSTGPRPLPGRWRTRRGHPAFPRRRPFIPAAIESVK